MVVVGGIVVRGLVAGGWLKMVGVLWLVDFPFEC